MYAMRIFKQTHKDLLKQAYKEVWEKLKELLMVM